MSNDQEQPKNPEVQPSNGFVLGDALYNKLKFFVQVVLPAFSTLYFTLGAVWGLPAVEQVIGTIAAFTVFLGVVLGVSSKTYINSDKRFDGRLLINEDQEGAQSLRLVLDNDTEYLIDKKEINFKVVPSRSQ